MNRKDEELIIEYQNGDESALEELVHKYKMHIFNFALRMLSNRADAEDVTQEVFMAIVKKKYIYSEKAKFSTWLFTVARNSSINKIRKRNRITSFWSKKNASNEFEQWEVEDSREISSEELVNKEKSILVKKAISNLPELQKEALILREYNMLSYHEISEILNCSLENVKILIFRAREQLRNDLQSFLMDGGQK